MSSNLCKAEPTFSAGSTPLQITTVDGSVSDYPYKLIVSNGTLTSVGGVSTLTTGGGGGGSGGDLTGRIPYNNATSSVVLGNYDIEARYASAQILYATTSIINIGTSTQAVVSVKTGTGNYYLPYSKGNTGQVLTLQTAGDSIWQTPSSGSISAETDPKWNGVKSNYVPYTNATGNVVLGNYDISSNYATANVLQATSTIQNLSIPAEGNNTQILSAYRPESGVFYSRNVGDTTDSVGFSVGRNGSTSYPFYITRNSALVTSASWNADTNSILGPTTISATASVTGFTATTSASSPIVTASVLSVQASTGNYYLPFTKGATGQVPTLQTNGTMVFQTPVGSSSSSSSSGSVVAIFDGGGSAIATATTTWMRLPYACTLTEWDLISYSTSPTLVIDVWKQTYNQINTATGSSIAGTAIPRLTNAMKNTNQALTGWTTTVNAKDYIFFKVNNIDTATYAVLTLSYTK